MTCDHNDHSHILLWLLLAFLFAWGPCSGQPNDELDARLTVLEHKCKGR